MVRRLLIPIGKAMPISSGDDEIGMNSERLIPTNRCRKDDADINPVWSPDGSKMSWSNADLDPKGHCWNVMNANVEGQPNPNR